MDAAIEGCQHKWITIAGNERYIYQRCACGATQTIKGEQKMLICLCQSDPRYAVPSGSRSIHPDPVPLPDTKNEMRCIKTGIPVMMGDGEYKRNGDAYICMHCGARIAHV